jgi:hypothetical protein
VLAEAVRDLGQPEDLRELGLAVLIDRPLGVFKSPAEPDRTLLLSHGAFSRSVAEGRLAQLAGRLNLLAPAEHAAWRQALVDSLQLTGLPLSAVQCEEGRIVSLADARRAAGDFLLLRTTRQAVSDFLDQYDVSALAGRFRLDFLTAQRRAVIVPAPCPSGAATRILAVYDAQMRPRLELGLSRQQGYVVRGGREYLCGGLQVLRLWESEPGEQTLREHDLRGEGLTLPPRASQARGVSG